jgi:hypothetical protein
MQTNELSILGALLLAAITFPVSYLVARLCLRGVVRIVTHGGSRHLRS